MNKKSLQTLEFNKIIDLLAEHADSVPGREMCKKLLPENDIDVIRSNQQETSDAVSMLLRKGSTSFGGNREMSYAIRSLSLGSSLSMTELLHIASLLDNVNRIKAYGRSDKEEETQDSLTPYFNDLAPLTPVSNEIRRCILSEDEIADDASPTLKGIRRSMQLSADRIHTQLTKMVNGSYRTYLQDAVITMRDNRYCLPVKAEHKNMVPGIVHDQSSTGSTLFIEPSAIVEINNEIRELELKEKAEIEVILANLSSECALHQDELALNQKTMTKLDFIFAKASLALEQNATMPVFNEDHYINIRKGRHPLLKKDAVVPIDIYLGKDFNLLIITGPNTGGKTVSLKTVGLFTLMGQAGLHIPAADRSELSIFTDVYADIGDEQSIEQSLSTFSSHMKNIVYILKKADRNSLCLFDELCAGTDPTEGAALAIAILERLHERGIRTMSTTHYSELKVFALSTPGVENACCEFDVATLSPTYRLLIGIPGKSNAFSISSKLGLFPDIIESAKTHISKDQESFEDLLAELERNRITMECERLEIASDKEEIKRLKAELSAKEDKLDSQKARILREANEEAREILQEAKDTADETIRAFQKAGPGASMKELEKSRDQIRQKISDKNSKLTIKAQKSDLAKAKPVKLQVGDMVKILSMGLKGTVSTLPDAKGNMFVHCGIMRTQTNIKDVILIDEDKPVYKPSSSSKSATSSMKMSKSYSVSPEINLLGKTVDEAIAMLDKYLDDAYLAHLPSVRIVHGKGTGALRSAVQSHLKRTKYVDSFRQGEYGEGDSGVTIAVFK